MDIWIDNTGLQAGGLCLYGGARSDYDVKGLLQLSTLLIFSNSIELTGFEPDEIANRTSHFRDEMVRLGLEPTALSIKATSRADYEAACRSASILAAADLALSYRRDERKLLGLGPLDLKRGEIKSKFATIHQMLRADGTEVLREASAHALDDRSGGAVEYMLSSSSDLRCAINDIFERFEGWTEEDGWQLESRLRSYLNISLGEQSERIYAPAVSRGELIDRQNLYVLQQLEGKIRSAAMELRQESLGIPCTHVALLQKAKGSPFALLDAVFEMRLRSRPFRTDLAALAKSMQRDRHEGRFKVYREIKEIGQQLRYVLGLDPAPTLLDAFDLQFVIGLPAPSLSTAKFYDWMNTNCRRVA